MSQQELDVAKAALAKAADRLHHLSMRYVGSFKEIATGQPVGLIPKGTPVVYELRDLVDLLMFTRAEINGITKILREKGVASEIEFTKIFAEEYEWLAQAKANQFGVTIADYGLVFKNPDFKNG